MTFPFFRYNPKPQGVQGESSEPPFSIVVEAKDAVRNKSWRPEAFIKRNRTWRTSGFLDALPAEELQNFWLLLSFLTPSGHIAPDVVQLAMALRSSPATARARMKRLAALRWQEQPFVLPIKHRNGLDAFMLAPGFVPVHEEVPQEAPPVPIKGGFREVIIAHSRQHYTRPRAEVEEFINRQLSRVSNSPIKTSSPQPQNAMAVPTDVPASVPENAAVMDEPTRLLRDELLEVGLEAAQADDLLARFDPVRIRRQLMWLPHRPVRNRVGFLIAAIKDAYEAPRNLSRPVPPLPFNHPKLPGMRDEDDRKE